MKVQILSDLHLEHQVDGGEEVLAYLAKHQPPGVHLLILAGDAVCFSPKQGDLPDANLLRICKRYPLVAYCPGNHEYYGTTKDVVDERLDKIKRAAGNLVVLSPGSSLDYCRRRFIGGTLW